MWAKITTCGTSRYSSSTDTDHSQMFSSKTHLSYNQKKTKAVNSNRILMLLILQGAQSGTTRTDFHTISFVHWCQGQF